jgi:hypothetical protein
LIVQATGTRTESLTISLSSQTDEEVVESMVVTAPEDILFLKRALGYSKWTYWLNKLKKRERKQKLTVETNNSAAELEEAEKQQRDAQVTIAKAKAREFQAEAKLAMAKAKDKEDEAAHLT